MSTAIHEAIWQLPGIVLRLLLQAALTDPHCPHVNPQQAASRARMNPPRLFYIPAATETFSTRSSRTPVLLLS
ncbi:hypothetical protein XELAEV_18039896mg, partial [Xenopus laevis]